MCDLTVWFDLHHCWPEVTCCLESSHQQLGSGDVFQPLQHGLVQFWQKVNFTYPRISNFFDIECWKITSVWFALENTVCRRPPSGWRFKSHSLLVHCWVLEQTLNHKLPPMGLLAPLSAWMGKQEAIDSREVQPSYRLPFSLWRQSRLCFPGMFRQ